MFLMKPLLGVTELSTNTVQFHDEMPLKDFSADLGLLEGNKFR